MMVFLADAALDASPPEVMNFKPPTIIMMTAIIPMTMLKILITSFNRLVIELPEVFEQLELPLSPMPLQAAFTEF